MTINKDDHQIPIKHLFFIFFLLCEHSIMIVEDFEFALTTQVALVTTAIIWIIAKRKISLGLLFLFIFVISVAWKWVLLVKRAQSKKLATMFYLEPACLARKTGSSWISDFVEYVWPRKVASCEAYYEAMHVESIWHVSPMDALVETVSDVCFRPLAALGIGISSYFNAIIKTTPLLWVPVVLILGAGLLVVIVFCLMRYRIRSPFLSIEPHSSNEPSRLQKHLKLEDSNSRSKNLKVEETRKREKTAITYQQPNLLPYPTGPNLLDHLVPHSGSHQRKPQY